LSQLDFKANIPLADQNKS